MTTSQTTQFLSEISGGNAIPEAKLAYLEQRVLNSFYAFVVEKFLDEKKRSGLTQAGLARRINRGTDVVSRWLASPSNWQISTVARLLVGISGDEAILSSLPLAGRSPRNRSVIDLLDDTSRTSESVREYPETASSVSTINIRLEKLDA